jgi:hypothetical protein
MLTTGAVDFGRARVVVVDPAGCVIAVVVVGVVALKSVGWIMAAVPV